MSDFVEYQPGVRRSGGTASNAPAAVRAATLSDVRGLAVVMSARGGHVEDHLDGARRLIQRLPVLLVADSDNGLVGWSGAQKVQVQPGEESDWLIAGLTVLPEQRRQGLATRLLRDVLQAIGGVAPDEPIFSVINARNPASIDLHESLGFA